MSIIDVTSGVSYATLSNAITDSSANDVIDISAGSYVEAFPNITHSLSIVSTGGLAYLSTPSAVPPNGRAILNVPGDEDVSLSISGLALSGAVDSANNGAGILFETGNANLTVLNSWIFGNQDGILTGGVDAASVNGMTVRIDHSELSNNGVASSNPNYGYDHNLYVNDVTQLTVTDSYFHDALGGHEIKSRALNTIITGNRIEDGPTSPTSYSIDLANGGNATIANNVIEKGASSVNKYVVHFGGEGTYAGSSLNISGNTFIDDRPGGAEALLNQSGDVSGATTPATIDNNTFYGFDPNGLTQDDYGAPYDSVSDNDFLSLPGPAPDTSHPFDFAVPEPASAPMLGLAMLAAATVRRIRGWRRR